MSLQLPSSEGRGFVVAESWQTWARVVMSDCYQYVGSKESSVRASSPHQNSRHQCTSTVSKRSLVMTVLAEWLQHVSEKVLKCAAPVQLRPHMLKELVN